MEIPSDIGLSDKVAIVCGGGAAKEGIGNGRAASVLLAQAGAKVLVADKNLNAAQKTADMISEFGGCAETSEVDVTNEKACK